MKKKLLILFITVAAFASCKKDEVIKDDPKPTGFSLNIYLQDKLSTGETIDRSQKAFINVWKADGKDFEVKSSLDALSGYAYDKTSDKSIKADYQTFGSHYGGQYPPGKYFVYVMLPEMEIPGSFAYSYTTFEVKSEQWTDLKKVFPYGTTSLNFDPWN